MNHNSHEYIQYFVFVFFKHVKNESWQYNKVLAQISLRNGSRKIVPNDLNSVFLILRPSWIALESTKLLWIYKALLKKKLIDIHLLLKIFGTQHFLETKMVFRNWTFLRKECWNQCISESTTNRNQLIPRGLISGRGGHRLSSGPLSVQTCMPPEPWMVLTEQRDVIQTPPCPIRTSVPEHKGNVLSDLCLLFPGLSPLLSQDVGCTYCYLIWQIWNSYF